MPNNRFFVASRLLESIKEQATAADKKIYSLGWRQMDEYCKIIKGQLSIITGIPSSGKSNWLDAVLVNMANNYKWRTVIFSPESQPIEEHVENIIIKKYQMPLRGNWIGIPNIPENEYALAAHWVEEHFYIMDSIAADRSIDILLSTLRETAANRRVDAFVLDPWNEIEHAREAYMSETEYLGVILGKIKAIALELDIHVFIVAHPTKLFPDSRRGTNGDDSTPVATPYDISGSANWYNKADNVFSVYRNLKKEDFKTTVLVQKVKRARLGKMGAVEFEYIPSTAGYR